ncbi:hypothetical protein EYC84_007991 [Monilinia fructicola]|uniref:Major facilitator superfamily (MFS) profile domain-containing protein n=1 Tax=Monilinia fructicola TaxID=38448 RepID=A0A5M9JKE3_MONFR|nr:hypothetical protein EYC84_007991 [Monilinia fructicola]
MVGWGILQDSRHPHIPGTVNLGDNTVGSDGSSKEERWDSVEPKKRGEIVLNPQPSESPNDPLNWSTATKMAILLILALTAGVTVSLGPMITTGSEDIATSFGVTTDEVSFNIVGIMQLTTGSGTFFTAAAAAVWGKRPVFIVSTLGLLATNTWGYFSDSFISLSIMRAVQGFCASPLETLVSATVSEIFFVHEKGKMLSIWNLFVMGGVKLGQLIAGFYHSISRIQVYVWNLRLDLRRDYPTYLLGTCGQANPLVTFPAVIFSAFTYSFYAAGLTLIALLQDTIFSAPPYNLSSSAIGLTNLPLFGVGIVGTLVSGYCADFVVQWMTRHNEGIYEPEFRLVLMFVAASFSTVAYIGFGYSVAAGAPIYVPIAFLGVQTFAVPFATSSMFTYVMDLPQSIGATSFRHHEFCQGGFVVDYE